MKTVVEMLLTSVLDGNEVKMFSEMSWGEQRVVVSFEGKNDTRADIVVLTRELACMKDVDSFFEKAVSKALYCLSKRQERRTSSRVWKSYDRDEWNDHFYHCKECGANMMVRNADWDSVEPNTCPCCGVKLERE